MTIQHQVGEGDCIGNISFRYGFEWTRIWNHPENAELRARRSDPNILLPGDIVHIPAKELKELSCATDRRHIFKRKKRSRKIAVAAPRGGPIRPNSWLAIQPRRHLAL
jgi:hypothetical protein